MKHILIAALCGASLAAQPGDPSEQAPQVVEVAIDDWAPFGGENLLCKGISGHIISEALARAGYEPRIIIIPWARIQKYHQEGVIDFHANQFWAEDVAQWAHFSEPYYKTRTLFLKRKGSDIEYDTLEALRDLRIGVGIGYYYSLEFDKADFLNKIEAETTEQCIGMLLRDRIDLTLDSEEVLRHTIHTSYPEAKELLELIPRPLAIQDIYLVARQDNPGGIAVIERFNQALAEMKKDGSYPKIIQLQQKSFGR